VPTEPDQGASKTVELPPKKVEEPPQSEAAKRRAEMQARRDAKQKELDAIKLGMFLALKSLQSFPVQKNPKRRRIWQRNVQKRRQLENRHWNKRRKVGF
jgi:hypothetical protein